MVIHPVREVNRAFSAGGLFLSYKSWGAAPGSPENTPLALRFAPSDFSRRVGAGPLRYSSA